MEKWKKLDCGISNFFQRIRKYIITISSIFANSKFKVDMIKQSYLL